MFPFRTLSSIRPIAQSSRAMSSQNSGKSNTFIHLHALDLRVHDSPSLHLSHDSSSKIASSITHFLPVYIFDDRQLDLSALPSYDTTPPAPRADKAGARQQGNPHHEPRHTRPAPLSRLGNFHRTSPLRLKFLLESVYGLRETYRRSGGDLLIGYGRPEVLIPALVQKLKEDGDVAGIWAQKEYSLEEANTLERIEEKLGGLTEVNSVDSKTMIPAAKLPFNPETSTPDVYTQFRQKVEGLGIDISGEGMLTEPLQTAKFTSNAKSVDDVVVAVGSNGTKLKPFPKVDSLSSSKLGAWVEKGSEVDSLQGMYAALAKPLLESPPLSGWSSNTPKSAEVPPIHAHSAIPFDGGEAAALARLEDYVGHSGGDGWVGGHKAKKYKDTRNGMIGEGFSTKFASLLALGVLSPKAVGWRVGELLEYVGKDKDTRKNVYCRSHHLTQTSAFHSLIVLGILFELLWRDYFQYTTLKYSKVKASSLFDPTGYSSQVKLYPESERPKPAEWASPNFEDPNDPIRRWCEGRTGVPFIDAFMVELKETGYMSNRGRQNVASYLTKDLYADWRIGAEWFEIHLVDYDTCSK